MTARLSERATKFLSRNGHDRAQAFGPAVAESAELGRRFVIDGEIAAPDERGVTHLDDLAIVPERWRLSISGAIAAA